MPVIIFPLLEIYIKGKSKEQRGTVPIKKIESTYKKEKTNTINS